jgi:cold shock protein
MPTGVVKFFNTTKGYGFIAPEGGDKDVFVHITALQRSNIATLSEGQKVGFDLSPGRDGRISADNIRLL